MASISKRVSGTWQTTSYGIRATATDTITTLPTTVYGDGTNATVGLKGNMEQSGTPTPQNPIQPSECGDRTANLFDKNTITPDKFVTTSGEISSTNYYCSDYISVSEGAYYLANVAGSSVQLGYVVYDSNKQAIRQGTISGGKSASGVVNISANEYYIRINMHIETSPDVVMVNSGSTALPYEPYGVKIPISSAEQTTPVYLEEVQTTRRIKKVVFTGSADETWNRAGSTHGYFTDLPNEARIAGATDIISSHYVSAMSDADGTVRIGNSKTEVLIYDNYTSVTDFKAFLAAQYAAGTPVTVWYVLAEPETGIVNEPLMKISDYADEVSGISIPTIDGANTLSVDTTVQPSEITAAYHGWHMGAVHERISGQWD